MLGWSTSDFLTRAVEAPPNGFSEPFHRLVSRRADREPFAYIVGTKEFWNLTFEVSPAVLIPRPETELLVESACDVMPACLESRVADVGTGSGCIAIAIAVERSAARVVATDTSTAALGVAARNLARHRVEDRVELLKTDLLTASAGLFDVIVSNPPYVPDDGRTSLQTEVRRFEPAEALFAGPEGLDVIERLIDQSLPRLRPGGHLLFEIGVGQDEQVRTLISQAPGMTVVDVRRDLQGIPRVAIARKS